MSEKQRGKFVMTYSGKMIDPLNPNPDDIEIVDIAHALSNMCRYGGHLHKFKSVAEHCIEVCMLAKRKEKLDALLHDAAEYLLLDMSSPVKWRLEDYNKAEKNLMKVISIKFGISSVKSEDIDLIDKSLQETELRDYILDKGKYVKPMKRKEAKRLFLEMFHTYKK